MGEQAAKKIIFIVEIDSGVGSDGNPVVEPGLIQDMLKLVATYIRVGQVIIPSRHELFGDHGRHVGWYGFVEFVDPPSASETQP